MPPTAKTFTRRWIKPSVGPDATTLEPLLARFRESPQIVEAWLVGSWITPSDGSPPYESTGVALVLDPPLVGGAEVDQVTIELIARLDETSPFPKSGEAGSS